MVVPIDEHAGGKTVAQQEHTVTMAGSSWALLALLALLAILTRGPPGVDQRPRGRAFSLLPVSAGG